jgi:hypothetical protein
MKKEIISEFDKVGLTIDEFFIENIVKKKYDKIKLKINHLGILTHSFKNNAQSLVYYKDNNHKIYDIIGFMCKGTFNQTYLIKDRSTSLEYVYRCPINPITKKELIIDNFIESFLNFFLSTISPYLENRNKIIKVEKIGFNSKYNFITSIIELMDGTLFGLLSDVKFDFNDKLKFLKKALFDIGSLLEELQKKFKFVHNDLKCDNIFHKKKKFYLGDFDNSNIEINNCVITNSEETVKTKEFQSKKDLFILINSLIYSFNNEEWKQRFFNYFPIISNIKNEEDFHTLYSYRDEQIDDVYIPSNFIKMLKKID